MAAVGAQVGGEGVFGGDFPEVPGGVQEEGASGFVAADEPDVGADDPLTAGDDSGDIAVGEQGFHGGGSGGGDVPDGEGGDGGFGGGEFWHEGGIGAQVAVGFP